jgi:hypothetical protein
MNDREWVARCSARLHALWPSVPRDQLDEVAEEIRLRALRQLDEPERAATDWLTLGVPAEVVAERTQAVGR